MVRTRDNIAGPVFEILIMSRSKKFCHAGDVFFSVELFKIVVQRVKKYVFLKNSHSFTAGTIKK